MPRGRRTPRKGTTMRKKLLRGLLIVPLVLLLSGCLFLLQGFAVLDGNLARGEKTKARFTLRPADTSNDRIYQFVVVGVPSAGGLNIGKATWGTNGEFGGPKPMPVSGPLPAAMATAGTCDATGGFEFANVSGTKWKAFLLQVRTKGKVNQKAIVDVVVRAAQDATRGVNYQVVGVTGSWEDDGDGLVNSADTFECSGVAFSSLYVH
jgi:hypothetical protein